MNPELFNREHQDAQEGLIYLFNTLRECLKKEATSMVKIFQRLSKLKCLQCQESSDKPEPFWTLSFPLEEKSLEEDGGSA